VQSVERCSASDWRRQEARFALGPLRSNRRSPRPKPSTRTSPKASNGVTAALTFLLLMAASSSREKSVRLDGASCSRRNPNNRSAHCRDRAWPGTGVFTAAETFRLKLLAAQADDHHLAAEIRVEADIAQRADGQAIALPYKITLSLLSRARQSHHLNSRRFRARRNGALELFFQISYLISNLRYDT
jgi:hypothetical protein